MSIYEAIMLICFGAAWPASLYKSYTARTNSGKSLSFLIIVLVGYASGILNKVLYSYDAVIFLYILNAGFVLADLLLYIRNARYDRRAALNPPTC